MTKIYFNIQQILLRPIQVLYNCRDFYNHRCRHCRTKRHSV